MSFRTPFRSPTYLDSRAQSWDSFAATDAAPPDLSGLVKEIAGRMRYRSDRGAITTYILEWARVDPAVFHPVVIAADGTVAVGGDSETPFSIQIISQVLTRTLALCQANHRPWPRVSREPSGIPFNSIVRYEREEGILRNPFIDAGAVPFSALIRSGHQSRDGLGELLCLLFFVLKTS